MAYIYRKNIGTKTYYYLRVSVRKKDKVIAKDIAYLGDSLEAVNVGLKNIPSRYKDEIRKTYKTLNRFIEANHYLETAKSLKLKKDDFLSKTALESIEACKLHWSSHFNNLDSLTKAEILKNFIIEFAFNTTSLEGNTITLKEAQNLLLENLTPKNKSLREIYDLQNTEKVFLELVENKNKAINHELICSIHDSLLEKIDARKGYRTTDIKVFRSHFDATPAPYVRTDMDLLLVWYNENEGKMHPFVLATLLHHKFEKIHPFMDGNGRTGRMLLNYILLKKEYPPLIIRKKNRLRFLEALHKADACPLPKALPDLYNALIDFMVDEMTQNYWTLFL